jgi:hypothetical protein
MKHVINLLTLVFLCFAAFAEAQSPLRTVSGKVVESQIDPSASIEVLADATYVGAVRFTLYRVADCEIHLFVDADASKRIRRLYWVQFEAYLPEKPTLRYTHHPAYSPVEMSGLSFYQRARFGQSSDVPDVGSEADRVYALLKEKGYSLPPETVNVTYKHFMSDMRKELLLIFIEDMSLSGTSFAELEKDGAVQPSWKPIAEKLQARAAKVFAVRARAAVAK